MTCSIYDLTQKNLPLPDSFGGKTARKRFLRLRIFRILSILFTLLMLALFFRYINLPGNQDGRLQSGMLLYLSVLATFSILLFSKTRLELRRLYQEGFQDCHDYNYVLYRTIYKNNRAVRTTLLLSMARYQLLLQQPALASSALALLSPEKLNKSQLKTFYLYRASAAFLSQSPDWEQDLQACQVVPVSQTSASAPALEEAFRYRFDGAWQDTPLFTVLRQWDQKPMPKLPLVTLFTGLLLLYTGCFGAAASLLPGHIAYRPLFETASASLLFLLWFGLSIYWLSRLFPALRRQASLPAASKICLGIALICLEGLFLLYGAARTLSVFFQAPSEESVSAEGLILMREDSYLGESVTYYRQAIGPLLCRPLTEEERLYYHIEDANPPAADNAEDLYSYEIPYADDDSSAGEVPYADDPSAGAAQSTDDTLLAEIQAVYQSLADAGQLPADQKESLTIQYSAKGTPYAVFEETVHDTETTQTRLVYDRVSQNGACDLYVYYQDTTPSGRETQTTILEFYAVDLQTHTVIPGEKQAWSDVPSKAYKEATGE